MIVNSCEVRWFFNGGIPRQLDDFTRELTKKTEVREDLYLKIQAEAVSVKMRGKSLEVKSRRDKEWKERLTNLAEGKLAYWSKQMFPVDYEVSDADSNDWLSITKHRMIITFSIGDGYSIELV